MKDKILRISREDILKHFGIEDLPEYREGGIKKFKKDDLQFKFSGTKHLVVLVHLEGEWQEVIQYHFGKTVIPARLRKHWYEDEFIPNPLYNELDA